jgi:hypothetical protein
MLPGCASTMRITPELKRFKLILKNKDEKYEEIGLLTPVFGQINSLLFYLTLPCVSNLERRK